MEQKEEGGFLPDAAVVDAIETNLVPAVCYANVWDYAPAGISNGHNECMNALVSAIDVQLGEGHGVVCMLASYDRKPG